MAVLTFERKPGSTNKAYICLNKIGNPKHANILYNKGAGGPNDGWESYQFGTILELAGDMGPISFQRDGVNGDENDSFSEGLQDYYQFAMTGTLLAGGDIYALLKPADRDSLPDYCFVNLFWNCKELIQAPALSAETLAPWCYANMFGDCTSLALPPHLPAAVLPSACYYMMFQNCKSLVTTPQMCFTAAGDNCCQNMFADCIALTGAMDSLTTPNATIGVRSFYGMFYDCIVLSTPPSLPATGMVEGCYEKMFHNCIALTSAPALPATTLAEGCYSNMFNDCLSLKTPPDFSATTLANGCCYSMFYNCNALTAAPNLPATGLAVNCYRQMFMGCASLLASPELPAKTLAPYCYTDMFQSCTRLSSITVNFTDWDDSNNNTFGWVFNVAYKGVFEKPLNLANIYGDHNIPVGWRTVNTLNPLTFEAIGDCVLRLKKCGNPDDIQLEYRETTGTAWKPFKINGTYTVPSGSFIQIRGRNNTFSKEKNTDFYRFETEGSSGTFKVSGEVLSLVTNNKLANSNQFARLFEGSNISNIDKLKLPATDLTNYCFYRMFADCEDLELIGNVKIGDTVNDVEVTASNIDDINKNIIDNLLPASKMVQGCYEGMFAGCKNLRNMPTLPAKKLAKSCYQKMFKDCEDLDVVPFLKADKLENDCYREMFYGCTKLNSIKCSFDDWNDYHATDLWLVNTKDCTIFIQDPKLG